MAILRVSELEVKCDVLCLDKDGLLFDRYVFWEKLWLEREKALSRSLGVVGLAELRGLMGVSDDHQVDPNGPLALAHPADEVCVTAAVLYRQKKVTWPEALQLASAAFKTADSRLDLQRVLRPRRGFPGILYRAKEAGMQVAIVTSDDHERTLASLHFFGVDSLVDFVCTPALVKRGKPQPDMLYYVANHFQVDVDRLVMIGDSLVDVQMARQAGAPGIAIPYPENEGEFTDYLTVASLADLGLYPNTN